MFSSIEFKIGAIVHRLGDAAKLSPAWHGQAGIVAGSANYCTTEIHKHIAPDDKCLDC